MKFKVTIAGHNKHTGRIETQEVEMQDKELDKIYYEGLYSPSLSFKTDLVNASVRKAIVLKEGE